MTSCFLSLRSLLAVLGALILCGCAGNQASNPFAAASPLASSVVKQWEKELASVDLRDYRQEAERNSLIYRLIFISDYRFSLYEADVMRGKARRDTFIDMSMFGLNTAATLITPGNATQILSAIAGGLSFSRNTIEKNFYMNHTAPVLVARMRVLRKEKLNEIVANLRRSPKVYPVELAIIDVLEYYNRGSMLGALQSVSNETSVQELRAAGGEVKLPPAAPPVRLQILKTAPAVLETRPEALDTTPRNSEISAGRRALGSQVIKLRKAGDSARAVEILAAAGVTASSDGAIRELADAVDSISTRSSLEKWESAFAATPKGLPKTAPPVIAEPLSPLLPDTGKSAPTTPIPKQGPAKIPNKIDPL
jgi:hypothetical protein